MSTSKSLYDVICENIKDGRLPDDFSLPKEEDGKVKFADGAMDGIWVYHMGHNDISDEDMKICEDAFRAETAGNTEECREKLSAFLQKHPPLAAIDDIQDLMIKSKEWINYKELYCFAFDSMVESEQIDFVKFGMLIVEMFNEPVDEIKKLIRTLSLSDEFTIFGVFNMMRWENGNDEIFDIAQKVAGWGRIHAIERLEPTTQEIKDWLLFEGKDNEVVNDYSALTIYEKSDVCERVKTQLSEKELEAIIELAESLLSEGPVTGISGIDDAEEYLSDLLDRCAEHPLTLKICSLADEIIDKGDFQGIEEKCRAVLFSDAARELITEAIKNGEGIYLAKKLDIDYHADLYAFIERDFDNGCRLCAELYDDYNYRSRVLELAMKKLPLAEMRAEPSDCMGLGKDYSNYSNLNMVIQNLDKYPPCGFELIIAAIHSPVIYNRNTALRVIDSWCKNGNCTLSELSPELEKEVEWLRSYEVAESVIENLKKYAF